MRTGEVAALIAAIVVLGFIVDQARAHDIYHDWKTRNGTSCCHDRDCAPATATAIGDGAWSVVQGGTTYLVPPRVVLPIPSPDGRSHLCVIDGKPVCFVPGEMRI